MPDVLFILLDNPFHLQAGRHIGVGSSFGVNKTAMEHLMGTALGEQGVLLEQHIQQF